MNDISCITKEHLECLQNKGFCKIDKFFESTLISSCKNEIEKIAGKDSSIKHLLKSPTSTHIHNFFLYGSALRNILFGRKMQTIHKDVFGIYYCLRNAVASSIHINPDEDSQIHKPIGHGWHRDTPQFYERNGKSRVLGAVFTYQVVVAIDDSNKGNSSKVLSGSHNESKISGHRFNDHEEEILKEKYNIKNLTMSSGDIVIIDDNLIHSAGIPGTQSRWLLFCSYTPWYIKPYFDFSTMELPNITEYEKHCLHKTSSPPFTTDPLRNTFQPNQWEDEF